MKGVSWNKKAQKWRAYLNPPAALVPKYGKEVHLGFYVDKQDAGHAFDVANHRMHEEIGDATDMEYNDPDRMTAELLEELSNISFEQFFQELQEANHSRGAISYRGVSATQNKTKCRAQGVNEEGKLVDLIPTMDNTPENQIIGAKAFDRHAFKRKGRKAKTNFLPEEYLNDEDPDVADICARIVAGENVTGWYVSKRGAQGQATKRRRQPATRTPASGPSSLSAGTNALNQPATSDTAYESDDDYTDSESDDDQADYDSEDHVEYLHAPSLEKLQQESLPFSVRKQMGTFTQEEALEALLDARADGVYIPNWTDEDIEKLKNGEVKLEDLIGSLDFLYSWEKGEDSGEEERTGGDKSDEEEERFMRHMNNPDRGFPVDKLPIDGIWAPGVFEQLVAQGKINPADYEGQDPANSLKNFCDNLLKAADIDPANPPDTSHIPVSVEEIQRVFMYHVRRQKREEKLAIQQAEEEERRKYDNPDGLPNYEACLQELQNQAPYAHDYLAMGFESAEKRDEYLANMNALARLTGEPAIVQNTYNNLQAQLSRFTDQGKEQLARELAAYDLVWQQAAAEGRQPSICAVLTPAVGMHISSYIPPAMTPEEIEMCNKFTSFEDWEADLKRRHQEQLQELAAVEVRLDKMTDDMRRIKWNKTVAEAIKLKDHPEHGPEMHQWLARVVGEDWQSVIEEKPHDEVFDDQRPHPKFNNPYALVGLFDDPMENEHDPNYPSKISYTMKVHLVNELIAEHPQGGEMMDKLWLIYRPLEIAKEIREEEEFQARSEKYGYKCIGPGAYMHTKVDMVEYYEDSIEFEQEKVDRGVVEYWQNTNETMIDYYRRMLEEEKAKLALEKQQPQQQQQQQQQQQVEEEKGVDKEDAMDVDEDEKK